MTNEQARKLRVLMQEALELVLGKPIAFVLVAQDEDLGIDIISNADRRDLSKFLDMAKVIVSSPPDQSISDHRAAGESADGAGATLPSGMECGHAAPQVLHSRDAGGQTLPGEPADAAAVVPCSVKIEAEPVCPNPAAGGLRVNLYPTPTIQKRYGKRVMLSLIFDLPVCLACISKLTPDNLMSGEQWKAFSKVAQQRNSGILADRAQTEIVLCHFHEPEYVALRRQIAQRAANESQPAPAGPQLKELERWE